MSRIVLFFCISFLMISKVSLASHAAGMDISYQCITSGITFDTYRITVKFYRDCGPGNWNAPNSFPLNYSSSSCGYNLNQNLPLVSVTNITPTCASITSPCNTPGVVGIEEYIYQGNITIPKCNDWVFTACENARNGAITTGPSGTLCVQGLLNNTQYCNNSPVFTEYPTPYLCVNQQFCYNNGAVDPDGDSLAYALVTPLNAAWGGVVNYNAGYSATNPISGTTTFDALTGDLCMLANQQQVSVVAMKVSEYRNGILIGSVVRDIQIIVLSNCATTPPILTGFNGTPQNVTTAAQGDHEVNHCGNGVDSIIKTISATLGASSDKVMTWSGVNLPTSNPATFTISNNGTNNPTGTFSWVPDYIDVLNGPIYYFTVSVTDDACPINNLFSYTYTINLTSSSGFIFSDITTDVSCPGNIDGAIDITVFGPSGVPTYDWTGPNGFVANTEDVSNLDTGQYTVNVTDAGGCSSSRMYDVLQNVVSLSEIHTDPSCFSYNDGLIDLSVDSGSFPYVYSWVSNGAIISNQEDLTNISEGTYTVTVTDAVACSKDLSILITAPPILDVNGLVSSDYNGQDISCHGLSDAQITASAAGGTPPYSYSIDNIVFSSSSIFSNLPEGIQPVFYKDAQGCLESENITITEPSPLALVIDNFSNISCFGAADAFIEISVSGGTTIIPSGYNFLWSSPSNGFTSSSEDLPNINQSGTYYCTVTDVNSCPIYSLPINIIFESLYSKLVDYSYV